MVRFTVEGDPGPKGSRTVGQRKNGSTFTRPSSKRQKPWEAAVSIAAGEAAAEHGQLEPPYRVTLEFTSAKPKRPTWAWPSKDDLDKLVRCTLDGLVKGGLMVDDRHVTTLTSGKAFAVTSGCRVSVESLAGC